MGNGQKMQHVLETVRKIDCPGNVNVSGTEKNGKNSVGFVSIWTNFIKACIHVTTKENSSNFRKKQKLKFF